MPKETHTGDRVRVALEHSSWLVRVQHAPLKLSLDPMRTFLDYKLPNPNLQNGRGQTTILYLRIRVAACLYRSVVGSGGHNIVTW